MNGLTLPTSTIVCPKCKDDYMSEGSFQTCPYCKHEFVHEEVESVIITPNKPKRGNRK